MEIAALEISNLSVGLGKRNILEDISFSIKKGDLTVLMGVNGAGKTTLLRTICGNLQHRSGEILIFGKRQKEMGRAELSKFVSYIPQAHTPVFCYSLLDFVLMGAAASKKMFQQPSKCEIKQAESIIKQLRLDEYMQTDYSTLSVGERQMALIARGMMQSAPVMLLDEPVSNLDIENRQKIMETLKELSSQGTTVFASMHDPNTALKFADRVVFLHKKKISAALERSDPDFSIKLESALGEIYKNVRLSTQEHFEAAL